MSEQLHQPTNDDREAWKAYWESHGEPWRTEPEISPTRQAFLAERRAIVPDEERDVYPFTDVKLTRADVEWLLATHESGGVVGPVDWSDEQQRSRAGLDLRGANLASIDVTKSKKVNRRTQLDLSSLPLARLRAGAPFGAEDTIPPSRLATVVKASATVASFVSVLLLTALPTPLNPVTVPSDVQNLILYVLGGVVVGVFALLFGLNFVLRRTGMSQRMIDRALYIQRTPVFLVFLIFFTASAGGTGLFAESFVPSALDLGSGADAVVSSGLWAVYTLALSWLYSFVFLAVIVGAADQARSRRSQGAGARLDGICLQSAHLEGADLGGASLVRANLSGAHLDHANLDLANCGGADLRRAVLDKATSLRSTVLIYFSTSFVSISPLDCAALSGVEWNGADVTRINWQPVSKLGDERDAHLTSLISLQATVQTYYLLAQMLRAQGLFRIADRLMYRALKIQRKVLLRESGLFPALGSWLLDLLAGYGYRPGRSIWWYLATIFGFAVAYFQVTHGAPLFGLVTPACGSHVSTNGCVTPLEWYQALVLSVSSFHGRGFFQPVQSLGDPVAILGAGEAIVGLFIEISFIATFTQRFFGAR